MARVRVQARETMRDANMPILSSPGNWEIRCKRDDPKNRKNRYRLGTKRHAGLMNGRPATGRLSDAHPLAQQFAIRARHGPGALGGAHANLPPLGAPVDV